MGLSIMLYIDIHVYVCEGRSVEKNNFNWYPPGTTSRGSLAISPQTRTITTPDGMASFLCSPTSGNVSSVQWLINGTRLEDLNLPNISYEFVVSGIGNFGAMVMRRIPVEWNTTVVSCRGVFVESGRNLTSSTCKILLQGKQLCITWHLTLSLAM